MLVCAPCALAARTRLSASFPVASSPLLPQTATSPTASATGAPCSVSSCPDGPAGVGLAAFAPEHAARIIASAAAPICPRRVTPPLLTARGCYDVFSEREAKARDESTTSAIGEQHRQAAAWIEIANPESDTRCSMPTTG